MVEVTVKTDFESDVPSAVVLEPCDLSICIGISNQGDAVDAQYHTAGGQGIRLIDAAYLLSDAAVDILAEFAGENCPKTQEAVMAVYMMFFVKAAVKKAGPKAMDGVREWIEKVLKEGEIGGTDGIIKDK